MEPSEPRTHPPHLPSWHGPRVLSVLAALLLLPVIWQAQQAGLMVMGGLALALVLAAGHSSRRRERVWQDSLVTQESHSAEELAQLQHEYDHLVAALDRLPEALVIYDAQERLLLCNQRHRDLFPKSAPYMKAGQLLQDIQRQTRLNGESESPGSAGNRSGMTIAGSQRNESDLLQPLSDGRWVRLRQKQGSDGSLAQLRVDVSTEVRLQDALQNLKDGVRRSRQMLGEIIDALPEGVVIYDNQQRLMMSNRHMTAMYPPMADLLRPGQKLETILREGLRRNQFPQSAGREEEWLKTQLDAYTYAGESSSNATGLRQLADGRQIRVDIRHLSGGGYLGLHHDCTHEAAKEREIQAVQENLGRISTTDSLTGIPNRRYFDVTAHSEWTRGQRTATPLSIALIDVDHFKAYNDRYGHLSGDHCLHAVAQTLAQSLEGAMPPSGFVARYGGEEFVVVLPGTPLAEALALLMRCQQALADRAIAHESSSVTPWITISVGLACAVPRMGSDMSQLLAAADSALYQAKSAGRNRIQTASLEFPNRRVMVPV